MTALIDVVFQLLIFFLLTSTYVSQHAVAAAAQVRVELPESNLNAEAIPHEQVTITVTENGDLALDGSEPIDVEELAVRLVEVRQEKPRTVVLIRGHKSVAYGRIATVLGVVRAANLPVSAVLKEK
jgi:biopolymer transport protein TolR